MKKTQPQQTESYQIKFQPCQLTYEEYQAAYGGSKEEHRQAIEENLKQFKDSKPCVYVSREVLKDYPDLREQYDAAQFYLFWDIDKIHVEQHFAYPFDTLQQLSQAIIPGWIKSGKDINAYLDVLLFKDWPQGGIYIPRKRLTTQEKINKLVRFGIKIPMPIIGQEMELNNGKL